MKSYSELIKLKTIEERFDYLKTKSKVGQETFGFDRYLNQAFYKSKEWKDIRNKVIARDLGNEMGMDGYPITGKVIVHHIDPITVDDVLKRNKKVFDMDNLISVGMDMHNAIHYGDSGVLKKNIVIERKPGDTKFW